MAQLARRFRANSAIRAQQLRVKLPDGSEQVMSRSEALGAAQALGKDLVEVDAQASPPAAHVMDFQAHLYQLQQAEEAQKKGERLNAKLNAPKEVRFGAKITEHDLCIKLKRAESFLEEGLRVSLVAEFADDAKAQLASATLDAAVQRLLGDKGPAKGKAALLKAKEKQRRAWVVTVKPAAAAVAAAKAGAAGGSAVAPPQHPPP